jgi:hypothetical protein
MILRSRYLAVERGQVEVGQRHGVHAASDLDGVPQRDPVEVPGPERTLPGSVLVVRLGQLQRGIFGHERAGSVPSHVAAHDAQAQGRSRGVGLSQQFLGVGGGSGRPGGVRVEAVPLIEQDALRPLEHHWPGAQHPG